MEIEKINKVIINGNIFNNSSLELFPISKEKTCRISNIYGKNGSGKTTIAKGIQKAPDIDIIFQDINGNSLLLDEKDKIYVYNEEFIDEKVKTSEFGIKTIIMLGEQKDLDDEINILKANIENLKKENDILIKKRNAYENESEITSPKKIRNDIEKILKAHWASRDKEIKNNQRNTQVQYESLVSTIINNKDESNSQENLLKEYKDLFEIYRKTDKNTVKIPDTFNKIKDYSKLYEELLFLISQKLDIPLFTEREKLILNRIEEGEQKFYEKVREELKKQNTTFCPYCFQDVSDIKKDIVESINKVLNKDVDEHKVKLDELKKEFININEYDSGLTRLDENLINSANNLISKINLQLNNILKVIDEKISNVYSPISNFSSDLLELIEELNVIIDKLENKRIIYNQSISNKEDNKNKLIKLNLKISWFEIKESYKDYEKQHSCYMKVVSDIKDKENEIKKTEKEITKLKSAKQNVKIANDKINIFLEYIFMTKDKLKIEYDENQKVYLVKSNGNDIRPKDLSTGERNIIALCYFFTKILENQNEKDEFKDSCLVVLDDPISSFDMENKVGLFTFLRMIFEKITLNNKNSKIINLTHSLEAMFNFEKTCSDIGVTYILYELKNKILTDFRYKKMNDYQKMLEDIYSYAKIEDFDEANDLDNTIGNTMRKLLESYSTFNYNKSLEDLTRSKEILLKIDNDNERQYFNNFMYRLVLNNESHTFDATRSLNFYDYISREEKVKTAKSILILLYLLDKAHLQLYFNNQDYLTNIESWRKEIIPTSF